MGQAHAPGTTPLANRLLADVQTLNQKVPTLPLSATQLINGSVALLNEIVNMKITGEEDATRTPISPTSRATCWGAQGLRIHAPVLEHDGRPRSQHRSPRSSRPSRAELNAYRRNTPLGFALYGALTRPTRSRSPGRSAMRPRR